MGILRKMKQRAAEMEKSYFPYTWKDKPSIESPINSVNLNHIESGINELDNRIVVLSKDKAEKTELANVFINFEFDENSGVMTFTRFDGSKVEKDTAMEKIALNCYLEGDNFVLELADGSKQTVSLSKFIDTYTFKSTDVIRMSVNGKEVSADIPDGKITLEKLEATVMSTIRQCVLDAQTAKGVAEQAASTAQGWAIGGESFEKNNAKYFSGQSKRYAVGGVEEGDETDNAQYYCEEARKAAEQAAGSVGFDGTAASVSAVDTHNLTGAGAGKKSTVQALLDTITQKLVDKVVTSDTFQTVLAKYLVNNGLTTEAGKFGLDAAFGKNLQDQITEQNSNLSAVKNKFSNDLFYINSVNQRVNDLSGENVSMISDITYMIKDKRIKTGCFGFADRTYSDVPAEVPKWGYVEYFQHADDYVTVRLYADYSTNIWIAQFVLGESKFRIDWVKK